MVVVAGYWSSLGREVGRRGVASWRGRRRADRALRAAFESAQDDPVFDPAQIRMAVKRMLRAAASEWVAPGAPPEDAHADHQVIQRWARQKSDWFGSGLRIAPEPQIDLVHLVNREGDAEDRVVIRVRVRLHRSHVAQPLDARTIRLDELWTLGRCSSSWILLSTDGDPLNSPSIAADLIPTPWADDARLMEQSLRELARPVSTAWSPPADLVASLGSVVETLADLALVDPRFALDLIGLEIERLFDSWVLATTGHTRPLRMLATATAVRTLLHPRGPDSRLVLADAQLSDWRVGALKTGKRSPRISVAVTASAIRYLVDSANGEHHTGSTMARRPLELSWVLDLADTANTTWRLASTSNPAHDLPNI